MKIMATFDGSPFAESILPLLVRLAALPTAEFVLVRAAHEAHGVRAAEMKRPDQAYGFSGQGTQPHTYEQAQPSLVANKEQALEAQIEDLTDYLSGLGKKLPQGASFTVHPEVDKDAASAIIGIAERLNPDVIVMATHGHTGLSRRLMGGVTEKVIESGVAPVLVVHPQEVKDSRKQ